MKMKRRRSTSLLWATLAAMLLAALLGARPLQAATDAVQCTGYGAPLVLNTQYYFGDTFVARERHRARGEIVPVCRRHDDKRWLRQGHWWRQCRGNGPEITVNNANLAVVLGGTVQACSCALANMAATSISKSTATCETPPR